MGSIQTRDGQVVYADRLQATSGSDSDLFNGAGSTTFEYNDTDGDANGESFLKTDLGRVDHADVSVAVNDSALGGNVGVQVTDARAADPSDYDTSGDFVSGTVHITLTDEDGSGEIADDTDISGTLEFEVFAVRDAS